MMLYHSGPASHSARLKNPAARTLPKIAGREVLITRSIFRANEGVPDSSGPERSHVRPQREPFNTVSEPMARALASPGYHSLTLPGPALVHKARGGLALSPARYSPPHPAAPASRPTQPCPSAPPNRKHRQGWLSHHLVSRCLLSRCPLFF